MWRVISVAVKEDDLDGVPVVAGPLGAFYEKLGQLHLDGVGPVANRPSTA